MKRFRQIQVLSSVVPFFSTFFVLVVTVIELKRNKSNVRTWLLFSLIFFTSGIITSALYLFASPVMSSALTMFICACILALTNFCLVRLQISVASYPKGPKENKTFTYSFKDLVLFLVLFFLLFTVACAVIVNAMQTSKIKDTNGEEDIALAVITLDEILATENEYFAQGTGSSFSGETTAVTGELEGCDYDQVVYHCKEISGIQTLQATKTPETTLILTLETEIKSGNAEVVVIVDGEYYSYMEVNCTHSVVINDATDKLVVVRLAAESAQINLSLTREHR